MAAPDPERPVRSRRGHRRARRTTRRERLRVLPEQTEWLEARCDEVNATLAPLKSFVLPGGTAAAAQLHVCRTVCRRAERRAIACGDEINSEMVRYLNRLSDLLFILARAANSGEEPLWEPGRLPAVRVLAPDGQHQAGRERQRDQRDRRRADHEHLVRPRVTRRPRADEPRPPAAPVLQHRSPPPPADPERATSESVRPMPRPAGRWARQAARRRPAASRWRPREILPGRRWGSATQAPETSSRRRPRTRPRSPPPAAARAPGHPTRRRARTTLPRSRGRWATRRR